jgi:hypothetical protein
MTDVVSLFISSVIAASFTIFSNFYSSSMSISSFLTSLQLSPPSKSSSSSSELDEMLLLLDGLYDKASNSISVSPFLDYPPSMSGLFFLGNFLTFLARSYLYKCAHLSMKTFSHKVLTAKHKNITLSSTKYA